MSAWHFSHHLFLRPQSSIVQITHIGTSFFPAMPLLWWRLRFDYIIVFASAPGAHLGVLICSCYIPTHCGLLPHFFLCVRVCFRSVCLRARLIFTHNARAQQMRAVKLSMRLEGGCVKSTYNVPYSHAAGLCFGVIRFYVAAERPTANCEVSRTRGKLKLGRCRRWENKT